MRRSEANRMVAPGGRAFPSSPENALSRVASQLGYATGTLFRVRPAIDVPDAIRRLASQRLPRVFFTTEGLAELKAMMARRVRPHLDGAALNRIISAE